MTAGEHLVSLSGLGSATAAEHLLAIVTGGAALTIFATQMALRVDTPETTIVTLAKRTAQTAEAPQATPKVSVRKKSIAVMTPIQETVVLTATDQLFIKMSEAVKTVRNDLLSTFTKTR